ncbi:MAG: hypothetical protein R6V04_11150 [bacterium]
MKISKILVVDAVINMFLGFLLLLLIPFPQQITRILGVPEVKHAFYASIMGGILIGIGLALFIEAFREKEQGLAGLGLGGAILINLCSGAVLVGWLIFGKLELPVHGQILLWIITVVLLVISSIELVVHTQGKT